MILGLYWKRKNSLNQRNVIIFVFLLKLQKYEKNPVDAYHDKLFSILPKTAIVEPHYTPKKLTHLEELEKHTYSVQYVWFQYSDF